MCTIIEKYILKHIWEHPGCNELLMLCYLLGLFTWLGLFTPTYQTCSTHDLNSCLGKITNYSMPLIYVTTKEQKELPVLNLEC